VLPEGFDGYQAGRRGPGGTSNIRGPRRQGNRPTAAQFSVKVTPSGPRYSCEPGFIDDDGGFAYTVLGKSDIFWSACSVSLSMPLSVSSLSSRDQAAG